jgi:hypothetical protein
VADVRDEATRLESPNADAAAAAAAQLWREFARIDRLTARFGDGDQRRERNLRAAAESNVTVVSLGQFHSRAIDAESRDSIFDVGPNFVGTLDHRGRRSADSQPRLGEADPYPTVKPLVRQREVLKSEMEPRPSFDRNSRHTPRYEPSMMKLPRTETLPDISGAENFVFGKPK